MAVISPIQPTSALNMQPSTPIEHLDKNTPAATPTDQQDSKSTTASPYVPLAPPSVEPPSSMDPAVKVKLENTSVATPTGSGNSGTITTNTTSSNTSTGNVNGTAGGGTSNNTSGNCGNGNSNNISNTSTTTSISSELKNILSLMKRPMLGSRDYENIIEEDSAPQNLLYDYSTWDAW